MQYEDGIRDEHLAVRSSAGVFDVSHMGEIETRGPGAEPSCSACCPTTLEDAMGGAQYTLLAARTAACSTTCSRTGWPERS